MAEAMRAASTSLFLLALLFGRPAWATDGPTSDDREAARSFATRGYELFEAGDYARAIDFFQQAEERFHAPPHWLYIARAQAKQGKLLEAKRSYERILTEKLSSDAPGPFKEAQDAARAEMPELEARIPSLAITLSGPGADATKVTIDGARVDVSQDASHYDPGQHTVVVDAPGLPPVTRVVTLEPWRTNNQHFVLPPLEKPSKTPILIAFATGAVGLGVGATTLGLALADPTQKGLPVASALSFALGGAALGAGTILVVWRSAGTSPTTTPAHRQRINAAVGPGMISVAGEF